MHTLFVCGAPHNKKGFELAILEGNKVLPEEFIQYIDKYDADKMLDGSTYVIQNINYKNKDYLLIENYLSINPSDQKSSRGAYIAVGIITDNTSSLSLTINYFCKIVATQSALRKLRDSRNAFPVNFNIQEDIADLNLVFKDIGFLANLALNHQSSKSPKKILFNDALHTDTDEINDNAIANQIIEQEELISQLKEKFNEEVELHNLTKNESSDCIKNIKELELKNNELRYRVQNLEKQISNSYSREASPNDTLQTKTLLAISDNNLTPRPMQQVSPVSTQNNKRKKTGSSQYTLERDKKSFSIIDILLILLMVILLLFGLYFAYLYFSDASTIDSSTTAMSTQSTQPNTEEVVSQKSELEDTKSVEADTPKINYEITKKDANQSVSVKIKSTGIKVNNKIEEEHKKKSSTLEKLREYETKEKY